MYSMVSSGKLLVTGASGFLGSEIVRLARPGGWDVRALVRNTNYSVPGVEAFVSDLADRKKLRNACEGVTALVHAAGLAHAFGRAANDTQRFNEINEVGTANVIGAALEAGVPHVVLISSVKVYGNCAGAVCDESAPCQPRGAYAVSKLRAELKAIDQMKRGGGSLTILRSVPLYGEGDRGNVAKLIRVLRQGRFIWPGAGENRKSLIYKEDAARACITALERPVPGIEIFNVSSRAQTMKELVAAICEALERPIPRVRIPTSIFKAAGAVYRALGDPGGHAETFNKFIRDDVYSGARFEARFNFCPAVPLSEGIRREVDSLRTGALAYAHS
jgi:nucleoside-diphosphate-sugar epimerase